METKSIYIFNLNISCNNHCRYCLLSWDGKTIGIDYQRSIGYAKKFYEWLRVTHPSIGFVYYFGYSMEHPHLFDAIKFMQYTNSPGGKLLQFDGMKKRNKEELQIFIKQLKQSGIETLSFTFYGIKEYHDKFAGRIGDYDLMMNTITIALEEKLNIEVGVPVTKENLTSLDELVDIFTKLKVNLFLFTPHSAGRGIKLLNQKITSKDFDSMSEKVKKYFNRENNRTQYEWFLNPPKLVKNRVLTLSLLPSNIEELERTKFEDVIAKLEEEDEKYFSIIPSFNELLDKYVDEEDERLYTKKDLYTIYRKKFIEEKKLEIKDLTDERFSGSIRY